MIKVGLNHPLIKLADLFTGSDLGNCSLWVVQQLNLVVCVVQSPILKPKSECKTRKVFLISDYTVFS